jgi:hypothetical protein
MGRLADTSLVNRPNGGLVTCSGVEMICNQIATHVPSWRTRVHRVVRMLVPVGSDRRGEGDFDAMRRICESIRYLVVATGSSDGARCA